MFIGTCALRASMVSDNRQARNAWSFEQCQFAAKGSIRLRGVWMDPHTLEVILHCDTCVLRLTCVRAQPQASMSVSRACFIPRHCTALFFWLKSAIHRFASVSQLLTVLARAISSLSIEVAQDCFIGLPSVLAFQPARVMLHSGVLDTRRHTV